MVSGMTHPVLFIQGAGEGAYEEDQLLADSLQAALGPGYSVHYPPMPPDDDATPADWLDRIGAALVALDGTPALVGHSIGAAMLLRYLAQSPPNRPIAGLYLIAAPYFGEGGWREDELRPPPDLAARLGNIPRLFLYHSRDDEIVPFAHLALYAALLPQATRRAADGRGHQWANDLSDVARDLTAN
jgi:predicted alpha/beta hydrolase family esterase